MSFVTRAWKGEAKLWQVFWGGLIGQQLLGVVGGFLVGMFGAAYAQGAGMDKEQSHLYVQSIINSPAFLGGLLACFIMVCISIWRCAWNASAKFWGYLARAFVIIMILCALMAVTSKLGAHQQTAMTSTIVVPAPAPAAAPAAEQPISGGTSSSGTQL